MYDEMGEITFDCGLPGRSGSGGVETLDVRDLDRREIDEAASSSMAAADAPLSTGDGAGVISAHSISVSSSQSLAG